jgi:hypothetical protein
VSDCDIFICDQAADKAVLSLPADLAKVWIGLRRLGNKPTRFPAYFTKIGIEPMVKASTRVWPILSIWPDELFTPAEVRSLLNVHDDRPIRLVCENGITRKNVDRVFKRSGPFDGHIFYCSSNPASTRNSGFSYYPVAKFFKGVDSLVLGGGYNSVHEAICYADLKTTAFAVAGGDDQRLRLRKFRAWKRKPGSCADELATLMIQLLRENA